METLWQDVRYGARQLARSPGFTVVAVLTLALGIGANTAIFSVVQSLLLKPLPFNDPDRVVVVWEHNRPRARLTNTISPANFLDWRDQNTVFEQMAAFVDLRANLTGVDDPEELPVQLVSVNLFPMLGVHATHGRVFLAEEGVQGQNRVVLLGDSLWHRRFGADPSILGKSITLNNQSYTVVGVLPAGFQLFLRQGSLTTIPAEAWVPYAFTDQHRIRRGRFMMSLARLKPGVSLAQAQAEMHATAARLEAQYPDFNTGWGVNVVPLQEQLVGDLRLSLLVLMAAVGFVLLIACANVANLLLSRAVARQHEVAIRTALGARRWRILQQLLTESALLGAVSGIVGLLLAFWGVDVVKAISPRELETLMRTVAIDGWVLGFTAVVSLGTAVLFGTVPAFATLRGRIGESLKEGVRGGGSVARSGQARRLLVASELALALVLLISAGLLIKSFGRLQSVPTGFNAENLLTLRIQLSSARYEDRAQRTAFFRDLVDRIETLPGVKSAGAIAFLPLDGLGSATGCSVVGRPEPPPGEEPVCDVRVVHPGYFHTMGIPLLRGRNFNSSEEAQSANVVIINEALARQMFPGEDPIGKKLVIVMSDEPPQDEIIGVVGDVKHSGPDTEARPMTYWPHPRFPYPFMNVVVRTQGEPLSVVGAVRHEVQALDPAQPIADVRTMEQLVANSVARPRFNMLLLGVFAAVALVLATVGIYGVMAYSVAQRTHEIGIRLALGAQRGDVVKLIVGSGLGLAVGGVVLGLAGAFALTRLLASLLFAVTPTDPGTFAGVAVLLMAVALLACWIPARRAMRVDPMVALRYE
ncbi:MAG: ABC transporter permease [Acidobacteria bacterium]|nr:ABC transporter permease [Acidobacteriota bacterium]